MGRVIRIDLGSPSDRMAIADTLRRVAEDVEAGRVSTLAIATVVADDEGVGIGTGVMYVEEKVDLISLLGALSVAQHKTNQLFEEGVGVR